MNEPDIRCNRKANEIPPFSVITCRLILSGNKIVVKSGTRELSCARKKVKIILYFHGLRHNSDEGISFKISHETVRRYNQRYED